jgi:hypothetical protein
VIKFKVKRLGSSEKESEDQEQVQVKGGKEKFKRNGEIESLYSKKFVWLECCLMND